MSSLGESADFDIRYAEPTDLTFVQNILKEPGMSYWYPPSTDKEIDGFANICVSYARYRAALTATYKGDPIGFVVLFLMPYRKVAHHCLLQILVDPKHQRRGVGRALIKNAIHHAKTHFKLEMIEVEILGESPLIPLLESFSFVHIARQEKYCKDKGKYYPRFLMEKIL